MLKILSLVFCGLPLAGLAQEATRVSGPVSGIVFDRKTHTLRPMVGIPGASYLGDALLPELEAASVSPDGSMALAVANGRLQLVSGLKNLAAIGAEVESTVAGADRFAWSADGSTAAIYSSSARQAQVLRDIGKGVAPGPAIDVDIAGAGEITSLAISGDSDLLAGVEGGVYLLAPGSAARLVLRAGHPAGLLVRGSDLFVADTSAGQIWLVRNFAASPAASIFLSGVPSPVGLQLSTDGRRLFVASGEDKLLSAFDMASGAAAGRVELDFIPSELQRFGSRDIWLMNSNSTAQETLYVGTGSGEPAVWFVPAGREQ